ncbi:MAG: hypothetical protein KF868_09610 [Acidobacteria bacterium]|nr:hypothetical protein [Acidobacteriota bacterium]
MTPEPTPVPTAPQGFFARLSGVYFTPGETFTGFKLDSTLLIPIILPLILTMAMGSLTNYLLTERIGYDNIVRKSMEPMVEAGWIKPEQAEEAIRQAANRSTAAKVRDLIVPFLTIAVMILAAAAVIKLFSMVMGAENGFKHLLAVTAWVFLALGLIQTALYAVILYLKEPDEIDLYNPIGSNLGVVLPLIISGLPKFITSLASWVDVFGIWRIALLAIGASAVSKKLKTSTTAIFLAVVYGLMALVGAGMTSMFSS